jgi:hypothetical protein
METITGWLVCQATIRSIRDYYSVFCDADLDRIIHEKKILSMRQLFENSDAPFHMEQAMA